MTKEEIAALCERVGFPQPSFDHKRKIATIKVKLTKLGPPFKDDIAELGELPEVSPAEFHRWCGAMSHAAIARFINYHLGTGYGVNDVYQMRRRGRALTKAMRALVRDHKLPYDPKT